MAITLERNLAGKAAIYTAVAVPITQLKAGKSGIVSKLEGTPSLRQHLLEMGFTKGTKVEFIRQAPLGDPIDLRLRGYRLSLRRAEAVALIVSPID